MSIKKLSATKQIKDLSKAMASAGLKLDVVGRRLLKGMDISFSLPEDRSTGTIKVFNGKTSQFELTVMDACPKNRQIVLRVQEHERKIVMQGSHTSYDKNQPGRLDFWRQRTTHNMVLPPKTKYKYEYLGKEEIESADSYDSSSRWKHTAEVTATVPSSDICFLMGYDEDDVFISMMPELADSVESAHQMLMPAEIRKAINDGREVMRSGEFFLVEITEAEDAEITKYIAESIVDKRHTANIHSHTHRHNFSFRDRKGDSSTDHVPVFSVNTEKKTFVTGGIGNKRHVLVFDGWYRMVKNTEVEPPPSEQPRRQSWD